MRKGGSGRPFLNGKSRRLKKPALGGAAMASIQEFEKVLDKSDKAVAHFEEKSSAFPTFHTGSGAADSADRVDRHLRYDHRW
jgi:hypothetical protein